MASFEPAPRARIVRKIMIDLTIMTVIGVVLALIGPFGSFAQPLVFRLVSWVGFAWIGYGIYSPMSWLVDRLHQSLQLPRPALWVLGVILATIPMTAVVWSMNYLPNPVQLPSLEQGLTSYFYVFLVGGAITAFFYIIETRGNAEPAETQIAPAAVPAAATAAASPADTSSPVSETPLLERLPAALGSDIVALEMEDHYVRVHTALGSELVLMRLRDAMKELGPLEGRQVHRSWWVARAAVEDAVRDGRNVRLKLARDIEAPVSRANVSQLRDAGWF
ncbi:MAG: LytTR family DNA-binding domain-containing protein [Erythrobacter sp.]